VPEWCVTDQATFHTETARLDDDGNAFTTAYPGKSVVLDIVRWRFRPSSAAIMQNLERVTHRSFSSCFRRLGAVPPRGNRQFVVV
jgi:hypothetical protein